MAYDSLEPIGEQRADYRIALLCSVVTNLFLSAFSDKKHKAKVTTPMEFMQMLDFDGSMSEKGKTTKKEQSVEEMKSILMQVANYQNNPKVRKFDGKKRKK